MPTTSKSKKKPAPRAVAKRIKHKEPAPVDQEKLIETEMEEIRDALDDRCKRLALEDFIEFLKELRDYIVPLYLEAAEDDVERKKRIEHDD